MCYFPGSGQSYTADVSNSSAVKELLVNIKKDFSQTPCIAVNAAGEAHIWSHSNFQSNLFF